MHKVIYGSVMPASFIENLSYDAQNPYRISVKTFEDAEETILHYADSVEILVVDGLAGEVIINDKQYLFGGQQVFIIPQNIVHRTFVEKCSGLMYVLKIHVKSLEGLLNLNAFTGDCGLDDLSYTCDRFEEMKELIQQLISSEDLFGQTQILLSVIKILCDTRNKENRNVRFSNTNIILRKVIDWTADNYGSHVLVENVASYAGYSKFHFSRWFKESTGITYYTYLSHIRIERAKKMLVNGENVNNVANLCGYENISHFIAMFRKYVGCTPGEYSRSFEDRAPRLFSE